HCVAGRLYFPLGLGLGLGRGVGRLESFTVKRISAFLLPSPLRGSVYFGRFWFDRYCPHQRCAALGLDPRAGLGAPKPEFLARGQRPSGQARGKPGVGDKLCQQSEMNTSPLRGGLGRGWIWRITEG